VALLASVASAGVVNGDFSAGETGWTRWAAPWGAANWTICADGPTLPEGELYLMQGQTGSFGWYQVVECPESWICTLSADWMGNIGGAGWAEVMLWSTADPNEDHGLRADTGNAADIAYKKDSWGMNPPTSWDWEPASLSPHPDGNGGVVHSLGYVVVALKLGSVSGEQVYAEFDNIVLTCVPEPATTLLLGLPLLLIVRRRR